MSKINKALSKCQAQAKNYLKCRPSETDLYRDVTKFILFALLLFHLAISCGVNTEIDVCDENYGRIIYDHHYVKSDFLTEDNQWNYRNWNKYRQDKSRMLPQYSCIPIESQKTLDEKIDEIEYTIDLQR